MTLKAKGLLSQMLSLPGNWGHTLKGLALINREKIDATWQAIRELGQAGYIVRSRERDKRGRLRGLILRKRGSNPKLPKTKIMRKPAQLDATPAFS